MSPTASIPIEPLPSVGAVVEREHAISPASASSGDSACQLSDMSANVPCTSTTGRGCGARGLHDQLFAPGGLAVGLACA